jgi:hypothetical protein
MAASTTLTITNPMMNGVMFSLLSVLLLVVFLLSALHRYAEAYYRIVTER